MNIRPNDFVLEIGSGHDPKTRSDILCDGFIDDDTQRGGSIVADRPIVEGDGQCLPFADASFDYVVCSHILEHVEDPERLIAELVRVASRGYIETPSEVAERLYGWPYHNWIVNLINGQLMIQKKVTDDQFGQLFHTLVAHDKNFARFHTTHRSLLLIQYEWAGKIDYQILPPDTSPLDLGATDTVEGMLDQVVHVSLWQEWLEIARISIPRLFVLKAKSVFARRRRKSKKTLQEIIVCPVCKGSVTWETDLICCGCCNVIYPIVRGIPRLLPP